MRERERESSACLIHSCLLVDVDLTKLCNCNLVLFYEFSCLFQSIFCFSNVTSDPQFIAAELYPAFSIWFFLLFGNVYLFILITFLIHAITSIFYTNHTKVNWKLLVGKEGMWRN